jgi:hypothetical protein
MLGIEFHDEHLLLKYLMLKTLAPPSDGVAMILGVWISIKSRLYKKSRKRWQTPDCILKIALPVVVYKI